MDGGGSKFEQVQYVRGEAVIVRKGFCRESELRGIFGPWRRSLISNNLSGPNVSSPISSNGQDCNAQTFEHFCVLIGVFLLPLCVLLPRRLWVL